MITAAELSAALSIPPRRASMWAGPLDEAMAAYSINTSARAAAFIAQIGHESGRLVYVREIWGPTKQQRRYERDFKSPWLADDPTNKLAYALGNSEPGDGARFMGRGLIQITGRHNYAACGTALDVDLLSSPHKLEEPQFAALSACWFWQSHGLNELADTEEFERITKRINGGLNGYPERLALYASAKKVLA